MSGGRCARSKRADNGSCSQHCEGFMSWRAHNGPPRLTVTPGLPDVKELRYPHLIDALEDAVVVGRLSVLVLILDAAARRGGQRWALESPPLKRRGCSSGQLAALKLTYQIARPQRQRNAQVPADPPRRSIIGIRHPPESKRPADNVDEHADEVSAEIRSYP